MIQLIGLIIAAYAGCRLFSLMIENFARAGSVKGKEIWTAAAVICIIGMTAVALLSLALLNDNNQPPPY